MIITYCAYAFLLMILNERCKECRVYHLNSLSDLYHKKTETFLTTEKLIERILNQNRFSGTLVGMTWVNVSDSAAMSKNSINKFDRKLNIHLFFLRAAFYRKSECDKHSSPHLAIGFDEPHTCKIVY